MLGSFLQVCNVLFIPGDTGLELYHINGCLYKLEPTDGFLLEAGETKTATLTSSDWMVSNQTTTSIFKHAQQFQDFSLNVKRTIVF